MVFMKKITVRLVHRLGGRLKHSIDLHIELIITESFLLYNNFLSHQPLLRYLSKPYQKLNNTAFLLISIKTFW